MSFARILSTHMRVMVLCALLSVLLFPLITSAYAVDSPLITLKSSFVDSEGRVNVVGTVRNYGPTPVHVTVGVRTDDGTTMQVPTYGRVIWPLTDSPFKIVLDHGTNAGDPFIIDVQEAQVPNYNSMLVLNYGGMAVGKEKAFVGTIKNVGSFEVRNVSVFAGIHTPDHKSQLDSVRSNIISVIEPGEEVEFTALPDPAVKENIFYYSCAGIDFNDPITRMETADGGFIPYTLNAIAEVRSIHYEDSTDSVLFDVRPYFPTGGILTLQVPQHTPNQKVSVMLDNSLHDASIMGDGKTLYIHFFVPKGDHNVQIQGLRNVPELPLPAIALAGLFAGIISLMKFKAAFKTF